MEDLGVRGDENIKMDLKTGSGDVNRIKLAQIGEICYITRTLSQY